VPTILYDRDCGFCRWSLAKLLGWDRHRRLRPVALQDPAADRLLAGMSEEERMASWHLVEPGGTVHSGGAAFAPLLRMLPGGVPLAGVAERMPGLMEGGYRFVAGHRSAIGPRITDGAKRRADRRIAARSR
jgi:predicted DCC family thiol-disulfide oxidoreductase YuxK